MTPKLFRKLSRWLKVLGPRLALDTRRTRIVVCLSFAALSLLAWRSLSAGGEAPAPPGTDEFAAWAITHPHEANAIFEEYREFVEARAAANFAFQNPETANAIWREDPEVARREKEAIDQFLDPWRTEQIILNDPQLRTARDEALRGISEPKRLDGVE